MYYIQATSIGDQRQWTIIGCDGLPYALGSRLIEKNPNLQHILLMPGLGHYEINMTRGSFKLLWDVCLKELGIMLGFKSLKAQFACQKSFDHHKSWQILQIFFFATCDELILPFVRKCIEAGKTPSLTDFYKYLSDAKDPNYIFLKDTVFTYMLALFVFRAGVRRNNHKFMLAGRNKFANLFYGLHMTTYQEIDFKDIKCRVLMPDEIKSYVSENESFSVSGNDSKGEGGDFVLEAKKRKTKMWLPPVYQMKTGGYVFVVIWTD